MTASKSREVAHAGPRKPVARLIFERRGRMFKKRPVIGQMVRSPGLIGADLERRFVDFEARLRREGVEIEQVEEREFKVKERWTAVARSYRITNVGPIWFEPTFDI
jgi:hypothetical protein